MHDSLQVDRPIWRCTLANIRLGHLAEDLGESSLGQLTGRDGKHGVGEAVVSLTESIPVQFQEGTCSGEARSFVSVDEGLRFRDMERESSGHEEEIGVEILTTEGGGGLGDGGLDETQVANPRGA